MQSEETFVDIILRGQALLIFVLGLIGTVAAFIFRQHVAGLVAKGLAEAASRGTVDGLRDRVDSHGGRLTSIEAAMRHLPTAEQVAALNLGIADLRGDVRALAEGVAGNGRTIDTMLERVERIETHLMDRRL